MQIMTYPRRLVFQRRKCLGSLRFFLIRSKDCNLHIVTIIVHYNKCSRRHKSARDDDTIQDLFLCWRKNVVHNGVCATTFSSLRWNQSLGTKGGQTNKQRLRSYITLCGDDKSSVLVATELHSFVCLLVCALERWKWRWRKGNQQRIEETVADRHISRMQETRRKNFRLKPYHRSKPRSPLLEPQQRNNLWRYSDKSLHSFSKLHLKAKKKNKTKKSHQHQPPELLSLQKLPKRI